MRSVACHTAALPLLLCAATLTGCASSELSKAVGRNATDAPMPNARRSIASGSERVFLTPRVGSVFPEGELAVLPEFTRRDAQLAVANNQPLLATSQWPEPDRPSLENTWYLWLPTQPNTQLFFSTQPRSTYYYDGAVWPPGSYWRARVY